LSQPPKVPNAAHLRVSLAAVERAIAHGICEEIEQTMMRGAAKE
jgi:hypothetical protein